MMEGLVSKRLKTRPNTEEINAELFETKLIKTAMIREKTRYIITAVGTRKDVLGR